MMNLRDHFQPQYIPHCFCIDRLTNLVSRSLTEMTCTSTVLVPVGVWCIAWTQLHSGEENGFIVAGCSDGCIKLFGAGVLESSAEVSAESSAAGHDDGVVDIVAINATVVSAACDSVHVWSIITSAGKWQCKKTRTLSQGFLGSARCVCLSEDAQHVACGSDDGIVRVYSLHDLSSVDDTEAVEMQEPPRLVHVAVCEGVAIERLILDSKLRVYGACNDGHVRQWTANGKLVQTWPLHSGGVKNMELVRCNIDVQHDMMSIATCAFEDEIFVWHLRLQQ